MLILVWVFTFLPSSRVLGQRADTTVFGWSERKLTAVVLSTIIPGSGQSYLGHTTKGAVITLGAFSSGLMTALSENNVIGRNERLNELKALYAQSNNWENSNALWGQMIETKGILDRDVRRRDLYLKVAVVFWVASIVDAVVFSDDLGVQEFGSAFKEPRTSLALNSAQDGSFQATFTYRF